MVEKLSLSKYQGYIEHVLEPEFIDVSEMYEEEKEIKTEEDLDPLSIINHDYSETNSTVVEILKQTPVDNDCEIKIEIVEDLDFVTESSVLS